ncbi:helix-turn-helix domain-containing protein, partial [Streptomyces sp. NRRL F-6674]|uniref:helix-turn-helix domain-containing protein n=1 Tax=Streptomyces sp. NRRL F-6674 TaxID=1463877 RepID=UPI001F251647
MPFARWRSLVRMSAATALLAQGHPVNLVAHRSGYATTSAFCAAFRRVTGASPTEYLREQAAPAPAAHCPGPTPDGTGRGPPAGWPIHDTPW